MTPDDSNEFFNHLNQPSRQRRPSSSSNRRPAADDFSSVPDPFDESGEHEPAPGDKVTRPVKPRGQKRTTNGPGLSPGIPKQEGSRTRPTGSGVVLTPSGVRRVEEEASQGRSAIRRVKSTPEPPVQQEKQEFHEKSRKRTEDGDVGWEEYAAADFPAMDAEEFGVKVNTTKSGRVVPVGVRRDLTDEAIKNQSIKGGKGKQRLRPKAKQKKKADAPRSLLQRVGDSLRLTRQEIDDRKSEADDEDQGAGGFERSGSRPGGKRSTTKRTPLGIAWSVFVEILKILMLVLLLRAYVVQVSKVDGPSMQPTLQQGDRLIVDRIGPLVASNMDEPWLAWLPGFLTPEFERGDLVVVRSPEDPGAELVKRLIALPGDRIMFREGDIYVIPADSDEEIKLDEPYITAEDLERDDGTYRSYRAGDLGGVREGEWIEVPVERIFVMGDNRSQSNDSRRWLDISVNRTEPAGIDRLWLHASSIEGRVVFRIYPFDRMWPPVR